MNGLFSGDSVTLVQVSAYDAWLTCNREYDPLELLEALAVADRLGFSALTFDEHEPWFDEDDSVITAFVKELPEEEL